ncbi:MAG: (4Fe-4S)-binding protein [Cyclobacteriaceae bacterium]
MGLEQKKIKKEYSNGEVTVVWQPHICIHSEMCFHGLKEVFNPNQKPWVNVEAASTETIVNQIKQCPSGALSYYMNADGPSKPNDQKVFTDKTVPAVMELQADKKYAWCSCGLSEKQPFCDGSHKMTNQQPHVFSLEEAGTKAMCMCKKTDNQPFCDGSHNG